MELLVVMALFSLTVAMASDIFLLSNRAQRRVIAITGAQADLRFSLEAMTREIRTGKIDFDRYATTGGIALPASHLIIQSSQGSREDFYRETSKTICPAGSTGCLALSVDGGPAQALTSTGVTVAKLSFYISPQQDPFTQLPTGAYAANTQPTVTIAIEALTTNTGQEVQTITAQTTVASRIYAR